MTFKFNTINFCGQETATFEQANTELSKVNVEKFDSCSSKNENVGAETTATWSDSESEILPDLFEDNGELGIEDHNWEPISIRGQDIFVPVGKSYVWPSASLLAEWIIDHPEMIAGKKVVELGCGIALPSMAAAKAGAEKIVATDYDDNYLKRFRDVCEYNKWENIGTDNIDWFAVQRGEKEMEQCDIVIAADVNYYTEAIPALAHCINAAAKTCVLVSRQGRISLDPFVNYLQDHFGYKITHTERVSNDQHGVSDEEIHTLWIFQRD